MSFLHKQEATSAMICHELPFDEQLILEIIQLLLESESIYLTEKNTYRLHL